MLRAPTKPPRKLQLAVFSVFPSEETHPGRWLRLIDVVALIYKQHRVLEWEAENAIEWHYRRHPRRIEWRSFWDDSFIRPAKDALPYVTEVQLPYLEDMWALLTDRWQEFDGCDLACAGSTPGGRSYLGEMRNRGIIEAAYGKKPNGSQDRSRIFYRRGASRIVVFPSRHPINGRHLDLSALTATP